MTALLNSRSAGRRTSCIAGILLVVVSALPASAGPIGFQASVGVNTESEDVCLGAGARIGAGPVTVIPNGEWFFVDSGSTYSLNVDATLNILPLGVASGYVGAGTGMYVVDPERGDSNTEAVLDLIAGFGFNVLLSPYAQVKWVVVDGNDPVVISAGVRF